MWNDLKHYIHMVKVRNSKEYRHATRYLHKRRVHEKTKNKRYSIPSRRFVFTYHKEQYAFNHVTRKVIKLK